MSAFSRNRRRILSLWLPRLPTDRIKRQLWCGNAAPANPSIVVAKQNNALQIFALDDAAAHLGLDVGLPLANARAICPQLQVFDADEAADARALNAIAAWCDRFTPLVALDSPHGLFLDITGCVHLFGGEAAMMRRVCDVLTAQGFTVSAAIAGTAVCARTMTRHVHGHIVGEGEEADAVKPLPVSALGADGAITTGLRRAGLKTIGDVASRARHEITARFGAGFTTLLEQALGQGDAPISPRKPLPDYIVEKRFAEPVATDGVISATLSRLAQMLVVAMAQQGKGARRLEACFFRTDGAVRAIAVASCKIVVICIVVNAECIPKLTMSWLYCSVGSVWIMLGFANCLSAQTKLVKQSCIPLNPEKRPGCGARFGGRPLLNRSSTSMAISACSQFPIVARSIFQLSSARATWPP